MSIRDQVASFEALASLDVDVRRMEEQIGKQRSSLEGMRAEAKGLEARLKTDRETLAHMDKTRGELTVEFRQMTQQIDKSREKLQRARNERETNAAQREIEEIRKLHRDREEEIGRLSTAVEEARKSIDSTEAKHKGVVQSIEGSQEGVLQQLQELESNRAVRLKEREGLVKQLPVVIYRRYESVRTRRPYAIAATHDGTCLGCHMTIPPMMFQKMLSRLEFEQCPHCRRILYYVPTTPGAAGEEERGSESSSTSRA